MQQLQRAFRGWRELAAVVLVLQQHVHNMQHQGKSGWSRATKSMKPHAAREC
jgi:hypothetical protein